MEKEHHLLKSGGHYKNKCNESKAVGYVLAPGASSQGGLSLRAALSGLLETLQALAHTLSRGSVGGLKAAGGGHEFLRSLFSVH